MVLSTSQIVRVPRDAVNDATVVSVNTSRRDTVGDIASGFAALVCAASAGIHAGLVRAHLAESRLLGLAFALDAVMLAVAALVIRNRRSSVAAASAVAVALLATALAYVLSRTTGLPVLHPETEPVDLLGVTTTLFELAGVVACLLLILRRKR
jgi:hypothetical protein